LHAWLAPFREKCANKKKRYKKGVDYEKDAFGIKESYKKKILGHGCIFLVYFSNDSSRK